MGTIVYAHKIEHSATTESIDGTDSYTAPKGWRKIDADAFAASQFFSQTPEYIEHRQFDWDSTEEP